MTFRPVLLAYAFSLLAGVAAAGTGYKVTSKGSDGKELTYEVRFGGGKASGCMTAYDPVSKSFVYLKWSERKSEKRPEPEASIWDHRTGEMIPLYKFPGVEQPLPVIPSIKEMKACPLTGDKNFSYKAVRAYD